MVNPTKEEINQIVNAQNYLCTCGSGLSIIDCCVTIRVDTTPTDPKTKYSNPKCYAKKLRDCSEKITREHFVSKSVLDLINVTRNMKLSQTRWLSEGEERVVSIESLSSKILCERHNSALSELDIIGQRFFEYIIGVNIPDDVVFINGNDVERWMLKVLCGLLSSGAVIDKKDQWSPNMEWLEILFGSENIPFSSGLYILRGKDIKASQHQIGIWPLISDIPGLFNGLYFLIGGFQFMFFMGAPRRNIPFNVFKRGWQLRYRPECIVIIEKSIQREVHLGLPPRGGFVVMKID
jgi:hypothetical protein